MSDTTSAEAPAQSEGRAVFIDVRRGSLLRVANALKTYGVKTVACMGYAGALDPWLAAHPGCEVYDYWRFNKGVTLLLKGAVSSPPVEVLASLEFRALKEKTIKMMDRHDLTGMFRYPDREALFYSLFFYFWDRMAALKPTLLVSVHSPHLPGPMVLYGVCALQGVKTVHVREVPQAELTYLATDFKDGFLPTASDQDAKSSRIKDLVDYVSKFETLDYGAIEPSYMKAQRAADAAGPLVEARTAVTGFGSYRKLRRGRKMDAPPQSASSYRVTSADFMEDRPKVRFRVEDGQPEIEARLAYKLAVRDLQEFEYGQVASPLNMKRRYVYFPLHYEPEKTSNPDGGDYFNVFEAVAALRAFLPLDVAIFVKEHYTQLSPRMSGFRGRSAYLYRALRNLPRVGFAPLETPTLDLIGNAVFTASQTGTACLEAACMGRKAVLMGDIWFSHCPNVYRFEDLTDYQALMAEPVQDRAAIEAFVIDWARRYTVNGYVTGSFMRMQGQRSTERGFGLGPTALEIAKTFRQAGLV